MRYFYDTEFIDNGETIEFISIGIVAEDGREYYAITDDAGTMYRAVNHEWLLKNVVKYLPVHAVTGTNDYGFFWKTESEDMKYVKSRDTIREELKSFFRKEPHVEYWAYFSAYDHVVLSQVFGKMLDLPLGLPMFTNDLMTLVQELNYPRLPEQLEGAHNALEDARWNKSTYDYLQALRAPKESPPAANPKRTRVW